MEAENFIGPDSTEKGSHSGSNFVELVFRGKNIKQG
jgi:hypothetical protein